MVPGRVVKMGMSSPSNIAMAAGLNTIVFNDDFILASTYQDSFQRTSSSSIRGTVPNNYCDTQRMTFTATTDTYTFIATQGLTGQKKCTHFVQVNAGIGGPGIEMIRADWANFQFQWSEFDIAAMASGAFLPLTTQSPVYLGAYEANFPNPIESLSIPNTIYNSYEFLQYNDPKATVAGDYGNITVYQNTYDGPYKNVGYEKISMGQVIYEWDLMQAVFNETGPTTETYNMQAMNYNNATNYTKYQQLDFFRSFLEDPVEIPMRPC
jgi:hypothetical protein